MVCSVSDCGKQAVRRGWCYVHYERWKRHGDPQGGRALNGAPAAYLSNVVLAHTGDECLDWPFARMATGYGAIAQGGKRHLVSRLVCEKVNGPPASPSDQAAHSCGRGDEGCVAPSHLRWASPRENSADKIAHGTVLRGEMSPKHKLTESAIPVIRHSRGVVSQRTLAEIFGVSQPLISLVQNGAAWRHVEEA